MRMSATIIAVLVGVVTAAGQAASDATLQAASDAAAQPTTQKRYAVVELSSIYMRAKPDYESALETQELMGTVVEVVSENGYWREIISPQPYRAWCTEKGIVEMNAEQIKDYLDAPKCIFTGLYGHIYETPSPRAATLCDLVGGDIMRICGKKICGTWTKVMLPSGRTGWVRSGEIKEHHGFRDIPKGEGNSESISDRTMEDIISTAHKLKGVPYLWGGMTPKGVDCSGLVRWSCLMNGITLPRNASQMVFCGDKVGLDALQRGDLVFFGTKAEGGKPRRVTHVGIYIGDGKIIHASHLVRVNSLVPGEADYYENAHKLIEARRL